jgi:uncharacterized protein YacL
MSKSPQRINRARTTSRIVGAIVGFVLGILYGVYLINENPVLFSHHDTRSTQATLLAFAVAGAAFVAAAAPLISIDPYLWLTNFLDTAPATEIAGATIGALVALAISAFVAILLGGLPDGLGLVVAVVLACVLVTVGVRAGRHRQNAIRALFTGQAASRYDAETAGQLGIVIDTSVFVDGRIVDVAKTGFLGSQLLIAGFVLEELQRLADSADPARRAKGKRGLTTVETLKGTRSVNVEVVSDNFPEIADVDARLIKLARLRSAALMTNDYNLNRVATIEGIRVLNLNELTNALKPIAATGESLRLQITKEGREPNQGVGYLEDGTMVVVENGQSLINRTVDVTVTNVLQTASGRLVFAMPATGEGSS